MVLAVLQMGIEPYHVHVLQLLVDLNFSLQCLGHLRFPEMVLQQLFDGEEFAGLGAEARQVDTAVAALAQLLALVQHQVCQLHFCQGLLFLVISLISCLKYTLLNKGRLFLQVTNLAFIERAHQLLSSLVALLRHLRRPKRRFLRLGEPQAALVLFGRGPGGTLRRPQLLRTLVHSGVVHLEHL